MLRYAPIDQSYTVSSPRIVNPYASSAYAPVQKNSNEDLQGACHDYLFTVYKRQGIDGILRLLDNDIIRDLRTAFQDRQTGGGGLHVHLGLEEIAVMLIALFLLLVILMD